MKNILVTGGAGFIGSNFINYYLKNNSDAKIINLDKLTYTFVKGDITNTELVNYIFSKYEVNQVINFAAESHVDRSILGSEVFFRTNVIGTNVLLEASRRFEVEKFLQVSTDEVYGSLGPTGLFSEQTPIAPNSPYSSSKASADMMALSFYHTYGLPVLITRCSNNYGQLQFPEKLIPLMIINAMNDKKLPVYGDGLNVRDWIYVIDHNRAVEKVLELGKIGEVYNIGADQEMKNIEIVKLILEKLEKSEDLIEYVKDRPGHDKRYAIDASKIKNELGWQPKFKFEDAISETIEWYKKNSDWWNRILNKEYQNYYLQQYGNRSY